MSVASESPAAAQAPLTLDVQVLTPFVAAHDMVRLDIDVHFGVFPVRVTVDTRALGGPAAVEVPPAGMPCDVERWRDLDFCMVVPAATVLRTVTLPVSATDSAGRTVVVNAVLAAGGDADADGDGMPDGWEAFTDLDQLSGSASAPDGDPDGDGITNIDEFRAGSHPRAAHVRYLAEGASVGGFHTRLALFNTTPQNARGQIRYLPRRGPPIIQALNLGGFERLTVDPALVVPGLAAAEFSMVVESNVRVVVERTMSWDDTGYGSHAEMATPMTSQVWYLAEGATHSGFELFYLLQNPGTTSAEISITYLLQDGRPPIVEHMTVAPASRENIWVNHVAGLADSEISAVIQVTNHVPIIVERALYKTIGHHFWEAGHASLGVTSPSPRWFFAEGATGDMFDLFVLLANPTTQDGTVDIDYLFDDGTTVTKAYALPAQSRRTVWVDREDERLRAAAVSMVVEARNGLPIIAERSMWWPGPTPADWREGHNTPGTTATGTYWALAEGEVGDAPTRETFVLVANTSAFAGTAKVTLSGGFARTIVLAPRSRVTLDVRTDFSMPLPRTFGVLVESVAPPGMTPAEIVVERAMYSADGRTPSFLPYWPAGTSAVAERVEISGDDFPLVIVSDVREYVGNGLARWLSLDRATFTNQHYDSANLQTFDYIGDGLWWTLQFAAANGARLARGTYEDARDAVLRTPDRNGLRVAGEGRGCIEHSVGRFVIHDVVYGDDGGITRFHADVEQRCGPTAPVLRGTIRFGM